MQADTRHVIAEWATRIALVVLMFELGGSLYEHLVVDAAWPTNGPLIQPEHGGLDRKRFWIPLHGAATLALPVALWAAWRSRDVRRWLLVGIAVYAVIRIWTFVYFIPRVVHFEAAAAVDAEAARSWVRWSLLRAPLLLGATYAIWRAWRANEQLDREGRA